MKLTPDYLWQGVPDGQKQYDTGKDTLTIHLVRPRAKGAASPGEKILKLSHPTFPLTD